MDRRAALESHVRSMPPERVADLLATLTEGVVRYARATPETLLHLLPLLAYRPRAFERLTLAHHQVIYAAVGLAEDQNDLRTVDDQEQLRQTLLRREEMPYFQGPGRVDHEALLAKVDADRPGLARVRAEEVIADLVALVFLWPDGQGGYHLLDDAYDQFGLPREPPSVAKGLGEFDFAGVRRIALTLGLDPTGEWDAMTEEIGAVLRTPERVRSLFRDAQHDVVHQLLGHAFLGTEARTFLIRAAGSPFHFPADGTGDPDLDWAIERGLLMPSDALSDRLVMPREVALAIRRAHPWPFNPAPQAVVGVPVERMMAGGGSDVAEGSRRALTALAGADTRLLAACAERPPQLRKDGLLMKRERKRLTKAAGGDEDLARVWVEAAAVLGLLDHRYGRVVLTERAEIWREHDTETRLAALLEAWTGTEDAAWCWPSPESPPRSKGRDRTGRARVRWALAGSLNHLPWGTSTGVVGHRLLAERAEGRELRTGAQWLLAAVTWYQPTVETEAGTEGRMIRALCEAEALGVVYGGATTEVGRVLSEHCRRSWEPWPRAGGEMVASVRRTLGLDWPVEGLGDVWGSGLAGREGRYDRGERAGRTVTGEGRESGAEHGEVDEVGDERERGLGFAAPGEEEHRELREVARRLFGEEWT
ncbi:hypothetical protein [Nocardiopsis valliformis]|uniref:hypothetical protein n=1 Tax=Nocardiopsis valliformis TaxID=239974 RepID=UPI001EFA00FD|nr:hypothetical protein [Nocardiopsis valliformis]